MDIRKWSASFYHLLIWQSDLCQRSEPQHQAELVACFCSSSPSGIHQVTVGFEKRKNMKAAKRKIHGNNKPSSNSFIIKKASVIDCKPLKREALSSTHPAHHPPGLQRDVLEPTLVFLTVWRWNDTDPPWKNLEWSLVLLQTSISEVQLLVLRYGTEGQQRRVPAASSTCHPPCPCSSVTIAKGGILKLRATVANYKMLSLRPLKWCDGQKENVSVCITSTNRSPKKAPKGCNYFFLLHCSTSTSSLADFAASLSQPRLWAHFRGQADVLDGMYHSQWT